MSTVLKLPEVHDTQIRSVVADPGLSTLAPALHTVLPTQAVAGLPSLSQLSSTHGAAGARWPAQYSPALQGAHTGAEVEVAALVCTVPAAQSPTARQVDWFSDFE